MKKHILLMCLVLLVGCQAKNYPADHLPADQILFGHGGGFTGETTTYILLKNGQVFKNSSLLQTTTALLRIDKKQAATFFEQAANLQTPFNEPGIISRFITVKSASGELKLVWGNTAPPPPAGLSLYESLTKLVQE